MAKPLILIVDDDPDVLKIVTRRLDAKGYGIATASDGDLALDAFRSKRPALVLMDVSMPRLDGVFVLREMLELDPKAPIIIFSGTATDSQAQMVRDEGAREFFSKPLDLNLLEQAVEKHLRVR